MEERKEQFRAEKKPSMKRRMEGWDYLQRCIYMITMATEGRKPLFGQLVGGTGCGGDCPHVVLTELGLYVNGAVERIPRYYPQVRILGKQVMPDHLHFIIYVQEMLPVPLGKVINGFKAGCNQEYRRLAALQGGREKDTETLPQSGGERDRETQPQSGGERNTGRGGVVCHAVLGQGKGGGEPARRDRAHGLLWETGYHDRILSSRGQLQRMIDYIHDNPRRLFLKRLHADFFRHTTIQIAAHTVYAFGNLQLLQRNHRIPVKCSRSLSDEAIAQYCDECIRQAQAGAVLVSPFISRGEKAVEQAALEARLSIIKLLDNGFPPFFKPQGMYFESCLAGNLLLLSPYEYRTEHQTITRTVCNELNELTRLLC